jgi:hypothetical protein
VFGDAVLVLTVIAGLPRWTKRSASEDVEAAHALARSATDEVKARRWLFTSDGRPP